ncbi:MAG TPA: pentapeptide repeat-containing protein [Ktedonobacterales bacterium]
MSDEQQKETTNATSDDLEPDDSRPSGERQTELRQATKTNLLAGRPPYAGVDIGTRGELNWILNEQVRKTSKASRANTYPDLRDVQLSGDMPSVTMNFANLSGASILGASLTGADLSFCNLSSVFILETNFAGAEMVGVNLSNAIIIDATFTGANLTGSNMSGATIEEADYTTDFSDADLSFVNLSSATISGNFHGADLTSARFDAVTVCGGYNERGNMRLDAETQLLDVSWNGANLALINWEQVPRLGDEAYIKEVSTRTERTQAYLNAARAYFGLAKALEAQNLTAPALRYRRRQHKLERVAQLRRFKIGQWLFSYALNIVSGYGDRPLRAFGVYLAVILTFAGIYFGITTPGSPIFFGGSQPLQLHEAVVFSLSSFHGRGFFPSTIGLGDPVAIVAALEAVVGLFIELVLIATFTRRLFER